MAGTRKATKRSTTTEEPAARLSAEEKAAIKDRARELKAQARAKDARAEGERDVLAKIAEMPKSDRAMAERIHAIVKANAPSLAPKTWYGMPAWARDGKIVCFFTAADKFKSRYATFGFEETATIDEGTMWPTSWALTKLTRADEAKIAALVKRAVS